MHRSGLLTSLLILVLAFSVACNKPTNDSIATDIKAKMFSEPLLKSSTVNVSVKDGTVTLSGQLSDDAARLAAERIAADAKGVSKVIDQTTVPMKPAVAEYMPPPAPAPARKPSHPAHTSKPQAVEPPSTPSAPTNSSAAGNPSVEAPSAPAPVPAAAPAPNPAAAPEAPPPPPPPQPVTVTLSEGTVFTVRTVDSIDSSTSKSGQTFRGSLDAPILVEGNVVVPKGLNVNLKLVTASSAGSLKGTSELTVSLDSFTYQGKTYRISSSDVQEKGESRGKRSAAVIGGGAVLGAIIGGIAGGGKGAAIGAGVGAGGGTAVQAATHGKQVRIPSETRLDFSLRDPLDVTYVPSKKSSRSSTTAPPSTTDQPSSTDTPPPQQPQ
jgi:outer membrane lipoprotein SlyB